MKQVTRRSALTTAGVVAASTAVLGSPPAGSAAATKLWTLEGELKIHPKFLYRYYLVFGDGQKCALFGADHAREPQALARLELPVRVRVRGELGTSYHAGGTDKNPSPFPRTWILYMDVHEVEVLR